MHKLLENHKLVKLAHEELDHLNSTTFVKEHKLVIKKLLWLGKEEEGKKVLSWILSLISFCDYNLFLIPNLR